MNKRQKKKKLRKRKKIHPNIITEFIDKTTIATDDILPSRGVILQKIAINFKDCVDNFKGPDVVLMDKNLYILDEKDKAELYDIIFRRIEKNEQ